MVSAGSFIHCNTVIIKDAAEAAYKKYIFDITLRKL